MLLYVMAAAIIVGCDNHPSYKTPSEAVEACQKELVRLKKQKDMSIEQLSKATSYGLKFKIPLIAFLKKTPLLISKVLSL